jgi:ribosome-associated protein
LEIARTLIDHLEEKKAENIVLLDITKLTVFADYFIICSGTSDRMLNALAKSVVEFMSQTYQMHIEKEGEPRDGWILLDAGEIIIHIFSPDQRNYYKLEDLWSQGRTLLHVQ